MDLFSTPKEIKKKEKFEEKYFPFYQHLAWPNKFPKAWGEYEAYYKGRPLSLVPAIMRVKETEFGWLREFFLIHKIHYWSTPSFLVKSPDAKVETYYYWEFECETHHAPGYPATYPKNNDFLTREDCDLSALDFAWLTLESLLTNKLIPKA